MSRRTLRPMTVSQPLLEKSGVCVLPHPVGAVRTVNLPCGSVVVAAGGGVVSAGLLPTMMRCGESAKDVAADASGEVQSLVLSSGLVMCMTVTLLPGGAAAMGVVGTNQGSVCVFVVESRGGGEQPALFKVCETSLCEYSDGLISTADPVVDVCVGLDPAGRPEFVCAASSTCVVVVDTQCFDEMLRAVATEAVVQVFSKHYPTHVGRPTSETFFVSFVTAEVVRVLVPERFHAAFTMDVALVVVFDNGEVRYIARNVVGGSVQLLLEHHLQRQARQSEVGVSMLLDEDPVWGGPRTLPHVLYAYNLSDVVHNICTAVVGYHAARNILLNDATLCYDPATHQMRLIVVGTEAQPDERRGQPCITSGWWSVAYNAVCHRDTLAHTHTLNVSSCTAPKSSSLPTDRRGLAAVLSLPNSQLVVACGNELHVCSAVSEPVTNSSYSSLRHVHTTGSVITSMASAETRGHGKPAILVSYGFSLALLLL